MKARALTPAEAVAQGQRILAQRRRAEALARRRAWCRPAVVETTVVRASPPAPARWPGVWARPTIISATTIVGPEINVPAPLVGETGWAGIEVVLDWLDEGVMPAPPAEGEGGCRPRRATRPEAPADLSTGPALPVRKTGPKYSDPIPSPQPAEIPSGFRIAIVGNTITGPGGMWGADASAAKALRVLADGRLYGFDRMAKAAGVDEAAIRKTLPLWTTCLARIGLALVQVPRIGCKLNVIEVTG